MPTARYGTLLLARARVDSGPLENLIDDVSLYINNELGIPTRPKRTPEISIIDLALTTVSMGPLETWTVDQEHTTGSDHELIVMEWTPVELCSTAPSQDITGWQIQALQANTQALEETKRDWQTRAQSRPCLGDMGLREDLAGEAVWIREALTAVLDQHTKQLWVTPQSKCWLGPEIKRSPQDLQLGKTSMARTRNLHYRVEGGPE